MPNLIYPFSYMNDREQTRGKTIASSPSSSVMAVLKVGREVHSVCAGNFVVAAEAALLFCATSSSKLVQLKFKRFATNRFRRTTSQLMTPLQGWTSKSLRLFPAHY